MPPFPWGEVLHLALGLLRWPPDAVWRATPREIVAALRPIAMSSEAMGAVELAGLMARFPDRAADRLKG